MRTYTKFISKIIKENTIKECLFNVTLRHPLSCDNQMGTIDKQRL